MNTEHTKHTVEVAYSRNPEEHWLITRPFKPGMTAQQAVIDTDLLTSCPELELAKLDLGIYDKPCRPDQLINPGDRVLIYRPLIIDPKTARKLRAEIKNQQK